MCGRVRLSSDYSEIKIRLKFAPNSVALNFEPDWNKPPTAPMLVAIRSVDGERIPKMMKWGLIPHWAKDDKLQYSTFNARAEEFTTLRQIQRSEKSGCYSAVTSIPCRGRDCITEQTVSLQDQTTYSFSGTEAFQTHPRSGRQFRPRYGGGGGEGSGWR